METEGQYDRIVMNPPFGDRRDAQHVMHAYSLLKPGGRMVAIMGEGVFFGQDKKAQEFRDWLESVGGTSEKLPEGSFMDPSLPVNTSVNGRMVVINKTESGAEPAMLSRTASPDANDTSVRIDAVTANGVLSSITSALRITPKTYVVDRFDQLPSEVQESTKDQDADERNTKGVFHKGVLYIVAGNHSTLADLEETIFHELIGHFGMRQLLGPQFIQKMNAIFVNLGSVEGLSKIAEENGFGAEFGEYIRGIAKARQDNPDTFTKAISSFILTEEVFAHIAQKKPTLAQKIKEIVGMVRNWLREHGFSELSEYGDTDISYLLRRARENLKTGESRSSGYKFPAVLNRSSSVPYALTDFSLARSGDGPNDPVLVNGDPDIVQIPMDVQIRTQGRFLAKPVRLKNGRHSGKNRGFGIAHIEAGLRAEADRFGVDVARWVVGLTRSATRILDEGNGRLILSSVGSVKGQAFIELRDEGDHYSVVTAFSGKERGRLIWSGRRLLLSSQGSGDMGIPMTTATESSGDSSSPKDQRPTSQKPFPTTLEGQTNISSIDQNTGDDVLPVMRYSRVTDALRDMLTSGEETTVGESGREYTPGQRQFFRNVGLYGLSVDERAVGWSLEGLR